MKSIFSVLYFRTFLMIFRNIFTFTMQEFIFFAHLFLIKPLKKAASFLLKKTLDFPE